MLRVYSIVFSRLTRAHVEASFAHDVYLFCKFGEADKSSLLTALGPEDKRWIDYELSIEKRTQAVWYTVPATILAQLVWKVIPLLYSCYFNSVHLHVNILHFVIVFTNTFILLQDEFSRAIAKAIDSIDRSVDNYEAKKQAAIKHVEINFRDRAYKLAAVANPANGTAFLNLIYNYNWNQKGALGRDKVITLAMSPIKADRYDQIFSLLEWFCQRFLIDSSFMQKKRYTEDDDDR